MAAPTRTNSVLRSTTAMILGVNSESGSGFILEIAALNDDPPVMSPKT
jgi:hypothetical protein